MKKFLLSAILMIAFVSFSFGQVNWEVDGFHTNVRFEIEHTGISFVDGEFTDVKGSMVSKSATDFEGAKFDVTIGVNSIDTRIEARNAHLISDDFFNAEKFPTITLKNAVLQKTAYDKYVLKGDLTMRDVTKQVAFDMVYNGQFTDQENKIHAGFTGTLTLDRLDYNIKFNAKMPSGIDVVGRNVKITVNTELISQ